MVDNIQNAPTPINNYFPDIGDPILELDDGNNSPIEYLSTQRTGQPPVDPSVVLSKLNILNQDPRYFGKNKYYR